MSSKGITRRLERLEAWAIPSDSEVLTVRVSRIGEPDKIIELRGGKPPK
jgi:hypothetical protein